MSLLLFVIIIIITHVAKEEPFIAIVNSNDS